MKQSKIMMKISSFMRLNSHIAYFIGLLLSLILMRIITLVFSHQVEMTPLRLILGFSIVFNFIVPILFVYAGSGHMGFQLSMTVPFIIYAGLYPLFDSVLLGSIALIYTTTYIVPMIVGGVGVAFIGCGSYFTRFDHVLSRTCIVCGTLIFILSAPNLVPVSYFVISGDSTILKSIQNFF